MKSIKKYIYLAFILFVLSITLGISINYENIDFSFFNRLYAVVTDESSISTKQSSTKSNNKDTENSDDMLDLLARVINGEARGEPYLGQVAVGAVIMNRVKSSEFPNTIAGVVYQKGQFTCVTDGQIDKPFEDKATIYKAAREAMNGSDPTNGCLYFYDPRYTKSKWLFSLKTVVTIGNHRFANEE